MQGSLQLLGAGPPGAELGSMRMGGVGPEDRPGFQEGKSKRSRREVTSSNRRCSNGGVHPQQRERRAYSALGNPEHPGRTRGKGVIPWYEGFLEWNDDYRTRARKKREEEKNRKLEEEQRKQEAERLQGLESAHADLALKFQRQQQ